MEYRPFKLGEAQLNVYRWMLNSIHIEINKIQIIAVLRDYMPRKASEPDYPNKPLIAVDIPLWTLEDTQKYIDSRIEAHKNLEPCSPEERWAKKDSFAVKKQGAKRAMRVLDSKESAERWIASNNSKNEKLIIEKRDGEDTKCKHYCNVAKFCKENIYNESSL
jgi:hypothetical protein